MTRRRAVVVGDKVYRWRRGKLVEIPAAWVGRTTSAQTIRKRPSKLPRKARMHRDVTGWPCPRSYPKRRIPGGHPRGAAPRHVGTKGARKLGHEEVR